MKNMEVSAKKLEALVKAMHKMNMVMLCWKIYSAKFRNPKIVVLLPNKIQEGKPASLSMVELAYHVQHHFWDFPALCTKKTECTNEQMDAINNLIDSMDLTLGDKKSSEESRVTREKDLLPYDAMPHIYEQNVLDVLERKIIFNAGENDEQFQKMLMDKNFVEIFWKLPEQIEEQAKRAAHQVKDLFPLQRQKLVIKSRMGGLKSSQQQSEYQSGLQQRLQESTLDFTEVRKNSPANDFQLLLDHHVSPIRNTTQRDVHFNCYAKQLRDILWTYIFIDKPPLNCQEITNAIDIYRMNCYVYDAFEDYNTWIREIKDTICKKKEPHLIDFFKNVIVANKMGLCLVDDILLDEQIACEEFYTLEI